jgi:hypothetical protein
MTMLACPKCAEPVTLPERASRLATVRCPLCQEEFPLAEVFAQLPPALIVVDDPQPVAAPAALVGWGGSQEPDELALMPAETVPGFAPLSIETDAARAPAAAAPGRRRPGAAAKKRQPKNPVTEGVKIVLGGIAGLAIAQVILWWVGSSQAWPKQRADMLQLAPKVARLLPWVVPERYRSERPATDAPDASPFGAGAVAGTDSTTIGSHELPERTFVDPNADDGAGDRQGAEPTAKKKSRQAAGQSRSTAGKEAEATWPDGQTPASTLDLDIADMPELPNDSLDDLGFNADLLADDKPIADPVVMPVESLAPAVDPEMEAAEVEAAEVEAAAGALRKAPQITPAELRTAVEEAQTAFSALKAAQEDDIRPLLRQTYPVLAKLGETVAFSLPAGDEWQAAGELLQTVLAEEEKLALLGRVGVGWLRAPARDNNGVLLVGTVKQVRQQGPYHVTDLLIPGGDQVIAVYRAAEPGQTYPLDSQLVVFGAILSDPRSELEGYDGDADYVVWQGLAEHVAAP